MLCCTGCHAGEEDRAPTTGVASNDPDWLQEENAKGGLRTSTQQRRKEAAKKQNSQTQKILKDAEEAATARAKAKLAKEKEDQNLRPLSPEEEKLEKEKLAQEAKAREAANLSLALREVKEGFANEILYDGPPTWRKRFQKIQQRWPKEGPAVEVVFKESKIMTWPLPFKGENSLTSVLMTLGWEDSDVSEIKRLEYQLEDVMGIDVESDTLIAWCHVQEVFRQAILETSDAEEWTSAEDSRYPELIVNADLL